MALAARLRLAVVRPPCRFASQLPGAQGRAQKWHDAGFASDPNALAPLPSAVSKRHWEIACDALVVTLGSKGFFSVDEMRRSIESLPPPLYERYGYYGRWAAGICSILVQKGHVPTAALAAALWGDDQSTAQNAHQWQVGDRVRVLSEDIRTRWSVPHLRVPGYIFGMEGVIEKECGTFNDPELLAFGPLNTQPDSNSTGKSKLFRVRFKQAEINPHYTGGIDDTIDVEIYESWLEEASNSASVAVEIPKTSYPNPSSCHNDGHGHSHADQDHDHVHLSRAEVELNAVQAEGDPDIGERLYNALREIAVEYNLVSAVEIREAIEKTETMNERMIGPSIVAKAWSDSSFRELLLQDAPTAIMDAFGVAATNNTAPTVLTFQENTDTVHNVVVCTLCSCYPRSILGLSPAWYASRSYRARIVKEPRKVLANDFGLVVPQTKTVRVHDSTADLRYAVLPQQPAGTSDWNESQLENLVPRDALIGVALASAPH